MRPATRQRLRRELHPASHIPYTAHVADTVVRTRLGDYLQSLHLAGASFESADDAQLNNWHERLNLLWRNIASPQVALWTHLVRRRDTGYPKGTFPEGFAHDLNDRYRERLNAETLMVNDLYVSILYRLTPHAASAWTLKALTRTDPIAALQERRDSLEACAKLARLLIASLSRYEPELLKVQPDPRHPGVWHSTLLEFLSTLINGPALHEDSHPIRLPRAPLHDLLATTRLLFGAETLEYRTASTSRFAAMLGIQDYPTTTVPGAFNALLAAPFPLILTQSFGFLSKAAGQGLLQRQIHRLRNAGDYAQSQCDELTTALDQLTSNTFAMGEHHASLQILSDPVPATDAAAARVALTTLNDRTALARSMLADAGLAVAREDLALEAAFWAQLPGQFALRPRKAPITSRNFAALSPFHNYPAGRATGNHWGDALALLITAARSPFYFSLHASDPSDLGDAEGGSRRDTGHTFLCGPTGAGKTVLIGFLMSMLTRQGVTQIVFDKDRGLEILVRALGGVYLPLTTGTPTGFNPLTLDPTPLHLDFLKAWLRTLVRRSPTDESLSAREAADLDQALRATLQLERSDRRLSRLIEYLDPTDPEGLFARLAPWCASTAGDLAWVFDNDADTVLPQLHRHTILSFDVTDFLSHATVRTPVTLYLFHLVRQLLDGRRLVCWLDEFWRLLADPAFEQFAKDGPKTWRKLNAVMALATQSPSDVLASSIARTIIEQTPTKIFFPNPEAQRTDYVEGFGLSMREFTTIRDQLEPGARQCLIRQNRHSIVCELDLKGFDAELAVLASRATTLSLAHRLMADCGPEPQHWLPWFKDEIAHRHHS
jgi:type IV secretion system protein VirB4